jgi:hypothetical protein
MNPAVSPQRSITLASKISPPVTRSCLHPFPRHGFKFHIQVSCLN